jgi:hypothetical protein
VGGS